MTVSLTQQIPVAALLRSVMPVDGPALEVAVPRVYTERERPLDGWSEPVPLPLVAWRALVPDPLGLLPAGEVLVRGLERAGVDAAAERAALAALLSRGSRPADGLPAWRGDWRATRPDAAFRRHRRGRWARGRGVWAAVGLDLDDVSVHRLGIALGLTSTGDDLRRSIQCSADRGRVLLHDLGAWPWAVTATGHLPSGWREDPAFTSVLTQYLRAARA